MDRLRHAIEQLKYQGKIKEDDFWELVNAYKASVDEVEDALEFELQVRFFVMTHASKDTVLYLTIFFCFLKIYIYCCISVGACRRLLIALKRKGLMPN